VVIRFFNPFLKKVKKEGMVKKKSSYCCTECGYESVQWLGKCPQCGLWNTFEEIFISEGRASSGRTNVLNVSDKKKIIPLNKVAAKKQERISVGSEELNRVLGGGVLPETTILFAGEPGIGKSTLLLEVCSAVAKNNTKQVLYISAEESLHQVRERSQRLGINGDNIYVISESDLDLISSYINEIKPLIVIIDSVQAIHDASISSPPGTLSQVRESALRLCQLAKEKGFVLFLIGHVTKEGMLAGPKSLEHLVDTVVYFEGDRYQSLRIIRVMKNRFGSTGEVGIFEMTKEGLSEIKNPSSIFLPENEEITPGRVTASVIEGHRPFLVEVQALTNETPFNNPLRRALGIELNKISLLLAVIERTLRLNLYRYDVFVKAVGGLRLQETASDIAIAVAIISSFKMVSISPHTVVIGELGLGGEVRKVRLIEARIREAARLGFKEVIIPKNNVTHKSFDNVSVKEIGHLKEIYAYFFEKVKETCK